MLESHDDFVYCGGVYGSRGPRDDDGSLDLSWSRCRLSRRERRGLKQSKKVFLPPTLDRANRTIMGVTGAVIKFQWSRRVEKPDVWKLVPGTIKATERVRQWWRFYRNISVGY